MRTIYLRFNEDGHIEQKQLDVPDVSVPWIPIHRKEFTRLCRLHAIHKQRPTLSEEDRKQHRKQSYQQYRDRVSALREQLGKPLMTLSGRGAPDAVVEHVLRLLRSINPETGKPYTGIEIAIETQLSASSVSRIRHGQRRSR